MKARALLVGLLLSACSAPPPATDPPTPTTSPNAIASPTIRPTVAPTAEPRLDGSALAALIDQGRLRAHLEALQRIADDTPGRNRATGTPGFDRSVAFVADVLTDAGYTVEQRTFTVGGISSTNVLAERPGSRDGVIMVGAHLDSVAVGPGINDNGSSVSALLVIAQHLAELPPPDQTIRLAFWAAEEGGPFGSAAYVDGLSAEEREEITAYLNFDMLASPNAVRFVYREPDAAPGSKALSDLFAFHLEAAALAWAPIDLEGDSDHGPFIAAGIPTGGLFSGGIEPVTPGQAQRFDAVVGQPADPCSHRACDTIDNVDLDTLEEMARIVAIVVADLATDD